MALTLSARCLGIAPSVTLAIDAEAKEMKARGEDVIGFGAGEPDFDTPEYIRDAAKYALDHGMTRYTPVPGTLSLRKQIAGKLLKDNNLSYEPTQIVVTNGAKQALFNAFSAILDPGDEVLMPAPCWLSYPELVRMTGGVVVEVLGDESNNFLVDADMLRQHVTPRTKAIVICSPSNPNGCVWSREILEGIAQLAVEKGLFVISDEIYEKLIYDGLTHVSIASLNDKIKQQTIVINGHSKAYAMTGWRIGYAAGPANVIKAMSAFQSHSTSNANSIAQYAAEAALKSGDEIVKNMVQEFDTRRKLIHQLINQIPNLSATLPEGAFYIMMNISALQGKTYQGEPIENSMDFARLLLGAQKVAVVPGRPFGADHHVRLSYATSQENIKNGLARIAAFVDSLE
ncbi:pyridoxal phosphate-dependent aminotransferase [Eubacteriales bacterium OttesenSCG-928-N13]|nr:pyridoxal phosphate-dependent aminotransferase [Eubacteriales bacterium OttesenSCG-928-N13]